MYKIVFINNEPREVLIQNSRHLFENIHYKLAFVLRSISVSAETESMVEVPFRFKLKYQFRSDTTHNAH